MSKEDDIVAGLPGNKPKGGVWKTLALVAAALVVVAIAMAVAKRTIMIG